MGALTEVEIFDCMATNLAIAAECCDKMASHPVRGVNFIKFREACAAIEGAARQASQWRQDTRWLPLGLQMEKAHQMAVKWLAGYKVPGVQARVHLAEKHKIPNFAKLAEMLRAGAKAMEMLKNAKTGRVGMILPEMQRAPTRTQGRQVQVQLPTGMTQTPGGIIIPREAA